MATAKTKEKEVTEEVETTVPETYVLEGKAVYAALANVVRELSVEKNGELPSNMGGKPYITASDVAKEVKRLFVENNLILLPNETVIKHENLVGQRLQVSIVITGTYEIVSTVDGSSVTVSGTGDGLATGTAVASNIASTNAFKNALLRTFLITEQSVEDAAKAGDEAPAAKKESAAQRKVQQARKAPAKTSGPANSEKEVIDGLTAKIREAIDSGEVDRNDVNAKRDELKAEGLTGAELLKAVIKEVGI